MSLRYDMTAPLARHVAQNINDIQMPYRTYRAGYVFRNEKPGPGRFRQFMQFDADSVGASGPAADAEMCMMMADTMEALGLKKGEYVVRVNDRRVLDGVMETVGLGGQENSRRRLSALRSIDKLDKFGADGVKQLLGAGRLDESGDFTKGVGLSLKGVDQIIRLFRHVIYKQMEDQIEELYDQFGEEFTDDQIHDRLLETVQDQYVGVEKRWREEIESSGFSGNNLETVLLEENLRRLALGESVSNLTYKNSLDDLATLVGIVRHAGYDDVQIKADPSVVRGLEYYTGTVFECEITADIPNEKGEIVQFGSVAGGGRYDGLVKRFTGQEVPATGFSIGVSRLATALKNLGQLDTEAPEGPIVVTVMDKDAEALAGYQKLVQMLRESENADGVNDLRAEMYQGNPKNFGKQLQYADRRGSPIAIIQGSAERENGTVQIKDLVEGARLSADITDHTEWRGEEGARPAQQTVKVEDMVATVRAILARNA